MSQAIYQMKKEKRRLFKSILQEQQKTIESASRRLSDLLFQLINVNIQAASAFLSEGRKDNRIPSLPCDKEAAFPSSEWPLSHLFLKATKEDFIIASYVALSGEISPKRFWEKCQKKACFVFPQIKTLNMSEKGDGSKQKKEKTEMRFVTSKGQWEAGPWLGMWQPFNDKEIPLSKIDIFLVPGLAFDRAGRRLGRGKGFYDRVLSQSSGIKIGLASTCQISNSDLPEEKHDVRMDAVLTDRFLFAPFKDTKFSNIAFDREESQYISSQDTHVRRYTHTKKMRAGHSNTYTSSFSVGNFKLLSEEAL